MKATPRTICLISSSFAIAQSPGPPPQPDAEDELVAVERCQPLTLAEQGFTELAPGFYYRQSEHHLAIEVHYFEFGETTVPALEAKVRELEVARLKPAMLDSWKDTLASVHDNERRMHAADFTSWQVIAAIIKAQFPVRPHPEVSLPEYCYDKE